MSAISYDTYAEAFAAGAAATNRPPFLLTITRRGGASDRPLYTPERLKIYANDFNTLFPLPANVDCWMQINGIAPWFRLRSTEEDDDQTTVDYSILGHAPDGNQGGGALAAADLASAISQGRITGAQYHFMVTRLDADDRSIWAVDALNNIVNDAGVGGGTATVAIASSSVADPTTVTTSVEHKLIVGNTVTISGHASTPALSGDYEVIEVPSPTTFKIGVNVTSGGSGGTLTYEGIELRVGETIPIRESSTAVVDVSGSLAGTITAISVDNPTHVTCVGHGLVTGDVIVNSGTNSTPNIDGSQPVIVLDADHFTVPVNVTVSGNAGTWTGTAYFVLVGLG